MESRIVTPDELPGIILDAAAATDRLVFGLVGPPGSGKTTLAHDLADRLGPTAVVVGMDGFHLSTQVLARRHLAEVKGAPDSFDAAGFIALLRRICGPSSPATVYAPVFDRALGEPIGAGIAVESHHRSVIIEGNYLLLDGPWAPVRELIDVVAYLELDASVRRRRLIDRHMAHGRTRTAATAWVLRSDEANAALIETTRDRADLLVLVS